MSDNVKEFSTDDFKSEVVESDTPVLVDFWAEQCGPCRVIAPVVEELANDYEGKVKFGKGVLEQIAPVLRGNARAAQKMATHIRNYLKAAKKKTFIKADWDKLCDHLGILPLGINPIELQLLRHLSERKECSLTYLAAKTGLTKPCLQRDYEVYLQKQNLMEISTAGRAITPKGKDYLEELSAGV